MWYTTGDKEHMMQFKRKKCFDRLIIKVQEDKTILTKLDYEELAMFVDYLTNLNRYLKSKGE